MINLFLIIGIALLIIITNYIALIYGMRLGKAMQKDIPPVPVEPVANAAKKVYKRMRGWPVKSYYQKKEPKGEEYFFD
jgi:beta-lactam-binding protein with PASTA domain